MKRTVKPIKVTDILDNPDFLKNKSLADVQKLLVNPPRNWEIGTLGKGVQKGKGWVLREMKENGKPTGNQIRYNPGGGYHARVEEHVGPYWRVMANGKNSGIIPAGKP